VYTQISPLLTGFGRFMHCGGRVNDYGTAAMRATAAAAMAFLLIPFPGILMRLGKDLSRSHAVAGGPAS